MESGWELFRLGDPLGPVTRVPASRTKDLEPGVRGKSRTDRRDAIAREVAAEDLKDVIKKSEVVRWRSACGS
jgi:hypothetical protein